MRNVLCPQVGLKFETIGRDVRDEGGAGEGEEVNDVLLPVGHREGRHGGSSGSILGDAFCSFEHKADFRGRVSGSICTPQTTRGRKQTLLRETRGDLR